MQYTPVLKARDAEFLALATAPPSLTMTPVLELQPTRPVKPRAMGVKRLRPTSGTTDAARFLDDVALSWSAPYFLDISRVATAATRPTWWAFLTSIAVLNGRSAPIPVLSATDSAATILQAVPLAKSAGRAAIRVSVNLNGSLPNLATALAGLSSALSIPSQDIDVILDWESLAAAPPPAFAPVPTLDQLEATTLGLLSTLPAQHGAIHLSGTAEMPADMQAGTWTFYRREWQLWQRINVAASVPVIFSDYAGYPLPSPGFGNPKYGHLRYTHTDRLEVVRFKGPVLAPAFTKCCKEAAKAPYFLQSTFSAADARIASIAAAKETTGDPMQWRQIALIHHFALVDSQLKALPPVPPPGTP